MFNHLKAENDRKLSIARAQVIVRRAVRNSKM